MFTEVVGVAEIVVPLADSVFADSMADDSDVDVCDTLSASEVLLGKVLLGEVLLIVSVGSSGVEDTKTATPLIPRSTKPIENRARHSSASSYL